MEFKILKQSNPFLSLTLIILCFGLTQLGCQKAQESSTVSSQASSAVQLLSECASKSIVDVSQIEIKGSAIGQTGKKLSFSLNQKTECTDVQKIIWSAPGAISVKTQEDSFSPTFSEAGNYAVSAKIVTGKEIEDVFQKAVVLSNQMEIIGPQIVMDATEAVFSLAAPSNVNVVSADWDFADGNLKTGTNVSHVFAAVGSYMVTVIVKDDQEVVTTLRYLITVIPAYDELTCLTDLSISGPTEAIVGQNTNFSIVVPSCLQSYLQQINWNFGDGNLGQSTNANHIYVSPIDTEVRATINLNHHDIKQVEIKQRIQVRAAEVNNNKCATLGQTRESKSEPINEEKICGVDGKQTLTYVNNIKEECKKVNDIQDWVIVLTTKELINEGSCNNQSCEVAASSAETLSFEGLKLINGKYYLRNGLSINLYTESKPASSCDLVKAQRQCNNGVLTGSTLATHVSCNSGCVDFGPHGTKKEAVVSGSRQIALACEFKEEGFFDTYSEVSDKSCNNGQIITSNARQGDLVTKGKCPTYSFIGTESFTACSADCGGQQERIFDCRNDKGELASLDRCKAARPTEVRFCDGNPEAARKQETTSKEETVGSSAKCPKNQIGVIVQQRTVETVTHYACIDHKVDVEKVETKESPWVEEKYCRDYVARRCSQDSLSNEQAQGRYKWLVKCASSVPAIKDFLDNFKDVKASKFEINSSGRTLYPTFMNSSTSPEKPWIAPKSDAANCEVPSTAYIAAVCVSSCATPEQEILSQLNAKDKISSVSFLDALTNNYGFVATPQSQSSMNSKKLQKVKVDQWVTELLDTDHDILIFKMKSGGSLRLTLNHPLLTSEGSMKQASEFKVGDSLVKLGGLIDPILSIEKTKHFGKVYNVFVKSSELHKNVVVTNGYFNGTAYFQNEGAKNMNRTVLRKKLVRGVFDK